MKNIIAKTFLLLSLSLVLGDASAAKVGKFFILNPDRSRTYITPDEAKEKSQKEEKVYFQKHGDRSRIIKKNSTLFSRD